MGLIQWWKGGITQKVLALGVASSIAAGPVLHAKDNKNITIVGTPAEIEEVMKKNLSPLGYVMDANREELKEWAKKDVEITLELSIPRNFSTHFGFAEGLKKGEDFVEDKVQVLFMQRLNKEAGDWAKEARKALLKKGIELDEKTFAQAITNSTHANEQLSMDFNGYACPMGGNPNENVKLSKIAAQKVSQLVIRGMYYGMKNSDFPAVGKDIFNSSFLNMSTHVEGHGSIYEDESVKNVVDRLNSIFKKDKVDYKNLHKMNDLSKFDAHMKNLEKSDPPLYDELKGLMDDLRCVKVFVKFQITLKIFGIEIQIDEHKDPALVGGPKFKDKKIRDPPPPTPRMQQDQQFKRDQMAFKAKQLAYNVINERGHGIPRITKKGGQGGMPTRR